MSEPPNLEQTAKRLLIRTVVSIACVVTFVGFVVHAQFIAMAPVGFVAVIPLAAAVLLLPRNPRRGLLMAEPTGDLEEDKQMRERIRRLSSLSTTLRVVYLGVALFCFFVLPELLNA